MRALALSAMRALRQILRNEYASHVSHATQGAALRSLRALRQAGNRPLVVIHAVEFSHSTLTRKIRLTLLILLIYCDKGSHSVGHQQAFVFVFVNLLFFSGIFRCVYGSLLMFRLLVTFEILNFYMI